MPIDAHAHYVPAQLIDGIARHGRDIGVRVLAGANGRPAVAFDGGFATRPMPAKLVEPTAKRRASLDRQGIDRQLVATWPDMYGYGLAREACAAWHRLLNDTLADWCADHADRFSWVASVPLTDAEDAAAELARAAQIGAVAAMIPANVEGANIGETPLDAFWAAAARLKMALLVHPVQTVVAPRVSRFGLAQAVQYPFDTTLGVGSIVMAGVLDRHPGLTLVLSHGGGAFPYLAARFDAVAASMDVKAMGAEAARPPAAYASAMAYDTLVYSPKALRFLADSVGLGRLVLGTDESFPIAQTDPLGALQAAGFSRAEIRAVAEDNPRRLIGRLK